MTDDPEPRLCGSPDPDNADLDRHDRKHEPYHCGAIWAPRGGVATCPDVTESDTNHVGLTLCPSGCGCRPGEADMRDCACDCGSVPLSATSLFPQEGNK